MPPSFGILLPMIHHLKATRTVDIDFLNMRINKDVIVSIKMNMGTHSAIGTQ